MARRCCRLISRCSSCLSQRLLLGCLTFTCLLGAGQGTARWVAWVGGGGGEGLVHLSVHVMHNILKCLFLAPLIEHLEWEDDHWKSLENRSSYYKHSSLKITTSDHRLHGALRQPVLICECMAHTQMQAVSDTVIICRLTKSRLSSGDLAGRVLKCKSRSIWLPLIDCVAQASHLLGWPPHL